MTESKEMEMKELLVLEANTPFRAIWNFIRSPFTVLYDYSISEPHQEHAVIDELIRNYKDWFRETTKGNPQSEKNEFAKELISLIEKDLFSGVKIGGEKYPCVLERENRTTNIKSDNFFYGYNYAKQSISTHLSYTTKGFETTKNDEVLPPEIKFISSDEYFEDELKNYTKEKHRDWMRLINRLITTLKEYHNIKPYES